VKENVRRVEYRITQIQIDSWFGDAGDRDLDTSATERRSNQQTRRAVDVKIRHRNIRNPVVERLPRGTAIGGAEDSDVSADVKRYSRSRDENKRGNRHIRQIARDVGPRCPAVRAEEHMTGARAAEGALPRDSLLVCEMTTSVTTATAPGQC
jgi:hypothetical protein